MVIDADNLEEDILEFGAESGSVTFEVRLAGAAVDIEESLESESMSGGAPKGEEHGDAGGTFEFEAAILIGANEDFVVNELNGGAERFAAQREVLLLFFLKADPAFELADGLFEFGAEFGGNIDGAGGRILGRAEAVDEVDYESGIEWAVVGTAAIFVQREFVREDEFEERCGGGRIAAEHLRGLSASAGRAGLGRSLQLPEEAMEHLQEFVGLFGPAFSLQADVLFGEGHRSYRSL